MSLPPNLTRSLISAGFDDLDRARHFLAAPELAAASPEIVVGALADAADPDQALLGLIRLIERTPRVIEVAGRAELRPGLARLLGASEALTEFLIRRPEQLNVLHVVHPAIMAGTEPGVLRTMMLWAVGADPGSMAPVATMSGPEAHAALRIAYRGRLTDLALRDLAAADPLEAMPKVGRELADLAATAIEAALAVSRLEAAERFAADDIAAVSLAVIGMGKCGARELNYVSDVDVIYVHSSTGIDLDLATSIAECLAAGISRVLSGPGSEPPLWEVDANLRPEGRDGALSRTLESHAAYYGRWAQSWEFQALLKARHIAGDPELGADYEAMVAPLVWSSSEREGFVESVQAMRRRVTANIAAAEVARQIKLGPGGLRDVEFTVQLLQLVHGRTDESLRMRDTTSAIAALSAAGYIGRDDAAVFDSAYRYLRVLEHRIQLVHLRRTHLMPAKEPAQRVLARAVLGAGPKPRTGAADLLATWASTKRTVRSLHERIFYRPLLSNASNLSEDEVRLSPEAAQARLKALGYADPKAAMRHIEALTSGVRRRAALQRQLLPVLLGWIAEGVDPDAGLLGFRRLSESLGESHWYLGMLRDSSAGAERLCHILANSRFLTDLLEVSPESAAWLGDDRDLVPRTFDQLWAEISSKLNRPAPEGQLIRFIRLIRRREILRVALADGAGLIVRPQVGIALSDIDRAAVLGALRVAEGIEYSQTPQLADLLVVAMGRQGGREIGYGSDADVMFVQRALPGADVQGAQEQALRIVARLTGLMKKPLVPAIAAEPRLEIDADLRPEGKQGPMVRSLEAYRDYYGRWAQIWEIQALLRARPMAGSDDLAAEFMVMADALRYGQHITETELREIRRIKARVEAERLPRGADPARHVKLGRGGLSDVEWLVQLLQLQHAGQYPALRTTSTPEALAAIDGERLLPGDDVETLDRAWQLASRIRSASMACTGRASDVLPKDRNEMEAVARWCGYEPGQAAQMEDDYLKATRLARSVFERHFYGFDH
ncbi:bifunctional [glutamine synthetase] adenylyltransferase/[glutamine synthetase]-adenylyl-L-tyrosine phosphorylase [Paeniglutamicibacter cryotolerans]|uniref:Glutamate-ammonia-ligase adenylyltransferase n=1 Tax=Paeniglutamicibacter cryotolerans TaxID=670079 RepID=A0A839QXE7_9MICC|nr:bifunctional [glutamine synthetase] adenylyltransferase/[glutamine synthetase]-adenylyl-L-tyrosine phosphorylase [Paeniglutamicibacter cryotolerans]MBB2996651.1 glutamate-ammonia-ligase adenylyltransferase [Paeniglutamicibacter cryotolerans]